MTEVSAGQCLIYIKPVTAINPCRPKNRPTATVRRSVFFDLCLAAAVIAVLFAAKISKQTRIQNEFVTKLETEKGRYDESTILLKNTSKYEAELLAKKLGARLRISSNGRFAVLYLDENTSIIDVCRDDRYKKYIASFSPDYKVRAAEAEEAEEENIHIAKWIGCFFVRG